MTTKIPTSRFVTHLDLGLPRHRMWLQMILDRLEKLDPDALQPGSESYELWRGTSGGAAQAATAPRKDPVSPAAPAQPAATTPTPPRTEWATLVKALNLSQPDAVSCQSTCLAMATGNRDIAGIRRRLLSMGDPGSPATMARYVRALVPPVRYAYDGNACLKDVYGWLRAGELLITHGWFTNSGHVICLDGLRQEADGSELISVKDPWSEFDASSWSYPHASRFYDGFYSDRCIYAACVAGAGFRDAAGLYRGGAAVDTRRGGMWVHRFMP